MDILVQNTGVYASSLKGKIKRPNKSLADITRELILESSHNKEGFCLAYQYIIRLSCWTDSKFCDGVPYFLWYGSRPSYKNIKIWGVRVYIINGSVTIKKLDDISHRGYFMGYEATTWFIIYWN